MIDCIKNYTEHQASAVAEALITDGIAISEELEAFSNDNTKKPAHRRAEVDLTLPEYTDLFPQLPTNVYLSIGPPRPGPVFNTQSTICQNMIRGPNVKKLLLECKTVVDIQVEHDGKCDTVPVLYTGPEGTLLIPGSQFCLQNICTDAGVTHSHRSHRVASTTKGKHNVAIFTQPYKNITS